MSGLKITNNDPRTHTVRLLLPAPFNLTDSIIKLFYPKVKII